LSREKQRVFANVQPESDNIRTDLHKGDIVENQRRENRQRVLAVREREDEALRRKREVMKKATRTLASQAADVDIPRRQVR